MTIALKKILLFTGLSLFYFSTAFTFAQTADTAPKPAVIISLNKLTLRENDCAYVQVWLKNENNIEINKAELNVSLPDHIKLSNKSCTDNSESTLSSSPISTDPTKAENNVEAKSVQFPPLYIKSDSDIIVGDYNLFFYITYQWTETDKIKQSIISAEKTIKVNFLGTDTVAGVPLGLSGFIVPGLFFWLVLNLFGVSWSKDRGLGDKLIYSVLVSFCLIGIAKLINEVWQIGFLDSLDISNGISLDKMLRLALAGIGFGLIVAFIELARTKREQRIENQNIITSSTTDEEKIKRFLKKTPEFNPKWWGKITRWWNASPTDFRIGKIVETKDRTKYTGSMGEKGENLIFLVGWSKIEVDKKNPVLSKLLKLEENNLFYELYEEAKSNGLKIEQHNPVAVSDNYESEAEWVKSFTEDEFKELIDDTKPNKLGLKPITIVQTDK